MVWEGEGCVGLHCRVGTEESGVQEELQRAFLDVFVMAALVHIYCHCKNSVISWPICHPTLSLSTVVRALPIQFKPFTPLLNETK